MSLLSDHHFKLSVAACAVLLGVLVSLPQWLHKADSRYQGVPVHLNSDEYRYLERTQEVLSSGSGFGFGFGRLGIAIGGGEELPNLAPGLIEVVYGVVFRPFGVRAATIFHWMDFVMPALLFIVMVGFCRACGLSRERALIAAILFSLLELYNLGRPIHQRASFLLVLLSMWCLIQGLEKRLVWGIFGGVIMGLLVGVYFWSWTAVWGWWGVLTVYSLIGLFVDSLPGRGSELKRLILFGIVGVVVAIPFVLAMVEPSAYPLYEEAFFRSGVGSSSVPESWPWTILFGVMAIGSVAIFLQRSASKNPSTELRTGGRSWIYVTTTIVTAFVLLNQHIIHGIRFLFASHYLFSLVFAAVLALVAFWKMRPGKHWIVMGAAAIFLIGIAYDNRSLIKQWQVLDGRFEEQHLASALPVLDELDRSVILSDPDTSSFVASHTHHDVVYAHYIQNELRSNEEVAKRFCLAWHPAPVQEDGTGGAMKRIWIRRGLIYGAAYDTVRDESEYARMRNEELALVANACASIDANPKAAMAHFQVAYVLWDEKRQPEWDLRRLRIPLEILRQDDGWSLWELAQ